MFKMFTLSKRGTRETRAQNLSNLFQNESGNQIDREPTFVIFCCRKLPICKKLYEEIQILNLEHINMKMAKNDKIMSWGDF